MKIKNDREDASKFGKRDGPRLFDPKAPKRNKDEDMIDKILGMIKDLHIRYNKNEGIMSNRNDLNLTRKKIDIDCKICLIKHLGKMENQ